MPAATGRGRNGLGTARRQWLGRSVALGLSAPALAAGGLVRAQVAHRRHGHVIHLNCHSMPAVAQAYSTEHPFLHHAHFVLGDRDGTSADPRLTRWMERFLNSRGYTVSINHPYKGVEIVRRHGRPAEGRHSVQVEVNKRLYMSEETPERHGGFEQVRQTLRELAEALLVQDLGMEGGSPPPVAPAAAHFAK